jgi:SAM-dependent methyltransferase
MSKQAEREYAFKIDQGYLFRKPFSEPRVFREFAMVLEVFDERLRGQGTILDFGCGTGWTSLWLARAGYRATGVDISERMIEIAHELSARENVAAEFIVADMEDVDLGRHDFDGALFFDCLHHCPDYDAALARAHAHLRPGGYLLLMETTWLHRYSPHARQVSKELGVTELGFTRRQLRRSLRTAGFTDISFLHDPGPGYRGPLGFAKASLRLFFDYFLFFPQAKNIAVARKAGAHIS